MSFNSKVNLIEFKSWSFSYFFLKSSHFINYNISEKKMEGSSKEKPQLKIGHYVLGKNLGAGTFGKVKGKNYH